MCNLAMLWSNTDFFFKYKVKVIGSLGSFLDEFSFLESNSPFRVDSCGHCQISGVSDCFPEAV
jgi:hypothetical protein